MEMKTRAIGIGSGLGVLMVAQTWVLWLHEQRPNRYNQPLFFALRLVPIAAGMCLWLAGARAVRSRDAVQAVVIIGALAGAGDGIAYYLHRVQDQAERADERQQGGC